MFEWLKKCIARARGQIYVSPEIANRAKRRLASASRREQMRGRCSGWDCPDERCPRQPRQCVCWDVDF